MLSPPWTLLNFGKSIFSKQPVISIDPLMISKLGPVMLIRFVLLEIARAPPNARKFGTDMFVSCLFSDTVNVPVISVTLGKESVANWLEIKDKSPVAF